MESYDLARIIGLGMSLILVIANLKGREIGLSDGLRIVALWGFMIVMLALVFSVLGW